MTLLSSLRQRRADAGLSQGELAARVGVSRQALVAIEAGRQVPSTTLALLLARALHCGVEDLFCLPQGPRLEATIASDAPPVGTRVAVGRVDGRWVAHPVSADQRCADGLLVDWNPATRTGLVEPLEDVATLEENALVAGCAPLLGVLSDRVGRTYREATATWVPTDSARALALLERRLVHAAGIHFADADDAQSHVQAAQRTLPGERSLIVNLAVWRQGLVVAGDNPLDIAAATDLARPDVRYVVRHPGAQAQRLLERMLRDAGRDAPCPHAPAAADHREVAALVRWGVADVGVAIEAVAMSEPLKFIPISQERFDLLIPHRRLDAGPVRRFVDLIDRPTFRAEASGLPGYDLSTAGHATTVAAVDARA